MRAGGNSWRVGVEAVEGMLEMLLCEERKTVSKRREREDQRCRSGKALLLLAPVGTSAVEGALWCGRVSG